MKEKPYVVSEKTEGGNRFFYCHQRGYPYIPVFGSIGDKKRANKVCHMMNQSVGAEEPRKGKGCR